MKLLKNFYFVSSNTIILVCLGLISCHVFIEEYTSRYFSNFYSRLPTAVKENYRHMSVADVNDLLQNTWSPKAGGWVYDEWVGFREKERTSRFVNIDKYGIRSNGHGKVDINAIDGKIWVFGGSTTFGYGVADSETIPAYIEKITGTKTVNFGRGYFYSAQENLLLLKILESGHRPKQVLFVDGINERCDIGVYQREMKALFAKAQTEYSWSVRDVFEPFIYFADKVSSKFGKAKTPDVGINEFEFEDYGILVDLGLINQENLEQRTALCSQYGIECKTFVQPFAGVHGRNDYIPQQLQLALAKKFKILKPNFEAAGALFVTSALDQLDHHAFVDDVHYSAEANKLVAQAMAKNLE